MSDARERIEKLIAENPVVLFMKGTPDFPQCGFSGRVVQILGYLGAPVVGVNVLEDADIRQGVKEYRELADHSPALHQGRIRRRRRHRDRDVPVGRTRGLADGCRRRGEAAGQGADSSIG